MPKFDEKHWKPSSLANVWDFVCLPCYRQTFLKQDGYSAFEPSLYCNLKGNVCCFSPNSAYKKTWRMQKNSFCLAHGVFYRWLLCRENRHIHQGHSDDEAHAAHLHVVNIAVPKQEKKTLKTCNGTCCVRDRKIPDVLKSSICDVFGAQMANCVKKKTKEYTTASVWHHCRVFSTAWLVSAFMNGYCTYVFPRWEEEEKVVGGWRDVMSLSHVCHVGLVTEERGFWWWLRSSTRQHPPLSINLYLHHCTEWEIN